MPATVTNPQNGDDLTAQSITTNVTDPIVAWGASHEAGLTTNGAARHTASNIDDPGITETTSPSLGALNVDQRLDSYAFGLSTLAGTGATGHAAKLAAIGALTYGNVGAINTALTTNATSTATALNLVRRAADGSANFAGTSAFASITASGSVVVTGAISGAAGTFTGVITAGSGSVAITVADGHLQATALTGLIPATSHPAHTGDVTTTSGALATTVVSVGGKTASAVATSVNDTIAATNANTASTIVKRDGSGNFSAGTITANLTGNASGSAGSVAAAGIVGTVLASQIDVAIARVANVPTNSGSGATGTWPISISGQAASVAAGAVGNAALAAAAVTGAKIAAFTVALANILEGAVYPEGGTLRVYVNPLKKWNAANSPVSWAGGFLDMTSHVPGAGLYLYCLISINGAGVAYVKEGVAVSGGFSFASIPVRDPNTTPLAVVGLQAGQVVIASSDIIDWRGPNEGAAGGAGGSQIGHVHGIGGEQRITYLGMDEGFAHQMNVPAMSILIEPLHYRSTAGIAVFKGQTTVGGFAAPTSGNFRTYGVYLDPATGAYAITNPADAVSLPTAQPVFTGNQRAVCYVHLTSNSTIIKDGPDGVNGWIEDARVWISGSSPSSIPVSVAEGGTGQVTFGTAGLVMASGTSSFTTVAASAGTATALSLTPTVTPGAGDAISLQVASTVATGTTSLTNAASLDVIAGTKTGTGVIANGYAARFTGPASGFATNNAVVLLKTVLASSIGIVVDTTTTPTGNLAEFRAAGTAVAAVTASGGINQGGAASATTVGFWQTGTPTGGASVWGMLQQPTLKPTTTGGAVSMIQTGANVDVSASGGTVASASGITVGVLAKSAGANTITNAYGIFVNTPTAGATNTPLAFATPAGAIAQEAWTAPTLLGTWVNAGGSWLAPAYFKDTQGVVHYRGAIKGGTANTSAWTNNAGYRPSGSMIFMQFALNAAGSAFQAGSYDSVDTTGGNTITGGVTGGYQFLDGISFDTR